ncbi:CDP-diacylglycerol--glycerol-3-phosphate 3-phosphatidyltransferase [candidate division FCPU426 bacterium]|nr:CDP-diacylglycerol--glycerol-3-phosphate 3-phosphatidyltransferase [candidate division FCPU426 bacterium]
MNLPNKLTLARIAIIPALLGCLLSENVWGHYAALLVFISAAITDYWDGKIARERNLVTNFGRIMDPLADKLLMASAFICFVQMNLATAWMVVLIIGREFAITGLRVLAAVQGQVITASVSGKHKTISQIVAVILILTVNAVVSSLQTWLPPWETTLASLGGVGKVLVLFVQYAPYWAMFVVAILSLYSGIEYLYKNREFFREPGA